jgi:hypothetical protein
LLLAISLSWAYTISSFSWLPPLPLLDPSVN